MVQTDQNVAVTVDLLANDTPGHNADGSLGTIDRTSARFSLTNNPGLRFVGGASPVVHRSRDAVRTRTGEIVHNPTTSNLRVTVTPVTPVALNNWSNTEVGKAVYVRVLGNDRPGVASAPLVPSSVRLELGPGLPGAAL